MNARSAFTLFELLAAITIVGIVLAVTLGSFQGWGDAHAVRGSAERVAAALDEARDCAIARRMPVTFEYQTMIDDTNGIKKIAMFRLIVEPSVSAATNLEAQTVETVAQRQPLGAVQRLPGGVWMLNRPTEPESSDDASDTIVFLPNGRALNPTPGRVPRLYVVSRKMRGTPRVPNIAYAVDVSPSDGAATAVKLSREDLGQ